MLYINFETFSLLTLIIIINKNSCARNHVCVTDGMYLRATDTTLSRVGSSRVSLRVYLCSRWYVWSNMQLFAANKTTDRQKRL